ncbi:MAG TPA: hypothetical protein VNT79_03345, partial [Phycisphaerae bacterium]|nr:hypothetical protein [Phycisphaerae bacterium]
MVNPSVANRSRLRATAFAGLVIGAYIACYNGNIDGPLDLYHEGERLAMLDVYANGGLPFRDAHVPHGIGEDVLKPLLGRWLFGDSVASLRRMGQNSYVYRGLLPPLGAAAIVLAAAALTRRLWATLLTFLILVLGWYEVSERPALAMTVVAALGMFLHGRRPRWLFTAGILAALGGLYSFETGVYLAAAAPIWLILDAWLFQGTDARWQRLAAKRGAIFLGGAAIATAPFLIWCAWNGLISDLIANLAHIFVLRTEIYPASYPAIGWRAGEALLDNLLVSGLTLGVFYLLPVTYGIGLAAGLMARGDARAKSALVLAAIVGGFFWMTVLNRPDLWHAAYSVAGFALFAGAAVAYAIGSGSNKTKSDSPIPVVLPMPHITRRMSMFILICILPSAVSLFRLGHGGAFGRQLSGVENPMLPAHLRADGRPMQTSSIPRLAGLRIPVDQADTPEALVSHIQSRTSPDETILDLSDQGLLYYLAQR